MFYTVRPADVCATCPRTCAKEQVPARTRERATALAAQAS